MPEGTSGTSAEPPVSQEEFRKFTNNVTATLEFMKTKMENIEERSIQREVEQEEYELETDEQATQGTFQGLPSFLFDLELPKRYGPRDEAKFLREIMRLLTTADPHSLDVNDLLLRLLSRFKVLLLKDDYDDNVCDYATAALRATPPKSEMEIETILAKAKTKGKRKRRNFQEQGSSSVGRRARS
ncbi:hypothetical protein J8273_6774 [Carpediemonas membranifera]|uniref:Uncharacterized protein n=1 Tax=Carpediemonas membranifera TaxID=201153 RepID=A0A8J6E0A6_9EUKA|nr:hypothetical protein J8273_6774 [Carpediemonas membranifera]|eukprot:KAG9391928.1 hypothetical protein J8273_6774 [Carpediemonas membranifera]